MKDEEKNVDEINNSDDFEAVVDDDSDDIEFIEIDLDEGFTKSSHEYFRSSDDSEDDEEDDEDIDVGDKSDDVAAGEEVSDSGEAGNKEDSEVPEEEETDSEEGSGAPGDLDDAKNAGDGSEDAGDGSDDSDGSEDAGDGSDDSDGEEDAGDGSDDFDDEEGGSDDSGDEEDDGGDFDFGEKEETEEERKLRRHKRRKIAAIISGSIVLIIAAVYIGFAVYFDSHFLFYTTINGVDFSMKDVAAVEDYMKSQVAGYTLTLEESDGTAEQIAGNAISLEYVKSDELKKLLESQNHFYWMESLWKKPEITASIGVKYNEEALQAEIAKLQCMAPENQVVSVDAHPEFKDTEFVVIPEVIGTQIDMEIFNAAVAEAINGFRDTVTLSETGCYLKPRFLKDSQEVVAAKDAMNSYLGANITYDFHPYTEVVDASVISQWVKVDAEMNVTFDQEAVRAYVASLAEKYNTIEKVREFTTANGNVVSVNPGTYGWEIDQDTEYENLTANIKNAETVTREPAYFSTAAVHETMDMGNTYAEVDLSAQHMWLFQDGQLVLDSDVVTGNPNIWNRETPSGVYSILEMERNKTLVGEKDPKTGKPEYETPVSFWMRVTWSGIGFHDATWQPYFGGDLYLSNGSHGCINMPYDKAEALFNTMAMGTPVVIHY